jgi:hypothetical protein
MVSVHVGVLVGGALGLWLCCAPSEAAFAHTAANLNLRAGPVVSHVRVTPAGAVMNNTCDHFLSGSVEIWGDLQ